MLLFVWMLVAQTANPGPLTLSEAIAIAHREHQAPKIARAQVERADAVRRMAIAQLLPELSVSGSYTRQPERTIAFGPGVSATVQEENSLTARAELNMTLLEAKNFAVLNRAKPTYLAVKERSKEIERTLSFDVAQAFLRVLSADQLATAAERRIEVAKKAKQDADKRFEHGLAGNNDVTRADLELATAELAASDAEAALREFRLALERYVGERAHAELRPPVELDAATSGSVETLIARAHEERPDLLALRAEAEAAELEAEEPLWGSLPKLSLDAYYDASTQEGFLGDHTNWAVKFSARWVLYDRGLRYRETEEKSARAEEARLVLERALLDVENQIKRSLVQIERARVSLSRAEARAALSAKNAEETAVRYREGLATAFELADSSAKDFDAQAELTRARFDLGISVLSLKQAVGEQPL